MTKNQIAAFLDELKGQCKNHTEIANIIGVDQTSISKWIRNDYQRISMDSVKKIRKAFKDRTAVSFIPSGKIKKTDMDEQAFLNVRSMLDSSAGLGEDVFSHTAVKGILDLAWRQHKEIVDLKARVKFLEKKTLWSKEDV
jgi:predicted XRE-type DNA-binding protein